MTEKEMVRLDTRKVLADARLASQDAAALVPNWLFVNLSDNTRNNIMHIFFLILCYFETLNCIHHTENTFVHPYKSPS